MHNILMNRIELHKRFAVLVLPKEARGRILFTTKNVAAMCKFNNIHSSISKRILSSNETASGGCKTRQAARKLGRPKQVFSPGGGQTFSRRSNPNALDCVAAHPTAYDGEDVVAKEIAMVSKTRINRNSAMSTASEFGGELAVAGEEF